MSGPKPRPSPKSEATSDIMLFDPAVERSPSDAELSPPISALYSAANNSSGPVPLMSKTKITDLPNEIIGMIIKALGTKENVSNLRLICKTMAALGARYLVEVV